MDDSPRITDNDKGLIHVSVDGHRVRDWIYENDEQRRRMMSEARWYVEGWGDAKDQTEPRVEKWFNKACENQALRMVAEADMGTIVGSLKDLIDTRLNNHLCDMKPNYDDSIVGFNEAWDIVRKVFADAALSSQKQPSPMPAHPAGR